MTAEIGARSRARAMRYGATVATSLLSKLGNVSYQVVAVPLIIASVGLSGYSGFAVVMASVGWIGTLSVGLGPAITERISADNVRPISSAVRETFMTALGASAAFVGVASALVAMLALVADPSGAGASQMGSAFAIAGITSAMIVAGGVFDSALLGLQRYYVSNTLSLFASVLSVLATFIASRIAPDVGAMVLAALAPIILARVLSGLALYRIQPDIFGRLSDIRWRAFPRIAQRGMLFAGIAFATFLVQQAGLLIVAAQLGSTQVAEVALVLRSLPYVYSIVMMITVPLWPAVAEAAGNGDMAWVRKAAARAGTLVMAYAVVAAFVVMAWGESLIGAWTGGQVSVDFPMLAAAGLMILLDSWANLNATVLIGLGRAASAAGVLLLQGAISVIIVLAAGPTLGQLAALVGPIVVGSAIGAWLLPLLVVRTVRGRQRAGCSAAA